MAVSAKNLVILAKKETTYKTDAAPVVATDAILTRNFQPVPLEVSVLERNLDLPTVGGSKVAITQAQQRVQFEVEIAGSGTAATAAKWSRLLEACGMGAPASLTTPTRNEQKFAAPPYSSLTIYHHYDSERRKMLGARGTFGFNFTAGAYPFLSFDFLGLLPTANAFDTSAPGTPDFTAFKEPVEVNTDNTTFTLDGFAAVLRSIDGAANININRRSLVGADYINRGNHALTGNIVIEAPNLATKDYLSTLKAGSEVVLALQHGTAAGNIVKLDGTHIQLTSVSEGKEDDILMFNLGYRANISTGYDDILITTM
ncbi:MAG: hypothetical protein DCC73_11975 [Proteobacteria bacterium]|nr:MAG: hypothetical protein DCC73_11975 [Pseudomonadota bacterium]